MEEPKGYISDLLEFIKEHHLEDGEMDLSDGSVIYINLDDNHYLSYHWANPIGKTNIVYWIIEDEESDIDISKNITKEEAFRLRGII